MHLSDLVPMLQVAVGPVILISGVGLLLLSMTNRLGRVIDRSRLLSEARRKTPPPERGRLVAQLRILAYRAWLLRLSITLAGLSVLLAAVLVIALFVAVFFQLEVTLVMVALFIACLVCLIASLVFFIWDINLSLAALRLELESTEDEAG